MSARSTGALQRPPADRECQSMMAMQQALLTGLMSDLLVAVCSRGKGHTRI